MWIQTSQHWSLHCWNDIVAMSTSYTARICIVIKDTWITIKTLADEFYHDYKKGWAIMKLEWWIMNDPDQLNCIPSKFTCYTKTIQES